MKKLLTKELIIQLAVCAFMTVLVAGLCLVTHLCKDMWNAQCTAVGVVFMAALAKDFYWALCGKHSTIVNMFIYVAASFVGCVLGALTLFLF